MYSGLKEANIAAFRRNQSSMYETSRLEEQINAARVLLKDLDVGLGIEFNHLWIQEQGLDETEDGNGVVASEKQIGMCTVSASVNFLNRWRIIQF